MTTTEAGRKLNNLKRLALIHLLNIGRILEEVRETESPEHYDTFLSEIGLSQEQAGACVDEWRAHYNNGDGFTSLVGEFIFAQSIAKR